MADGDEPFAALAMLVARAFYDDVEVVLMDKLTRVRQALTEKELAEAVGLSEKHVRKALRLLLLDRIVARTVVKLDEVERDQLTISEFHERQQNAGEEVRFHVDLDAVPDVVKYKLHEVLSRARGGQPDQRADVDVAWRCESCDRNFTEADVFDLQDRARGLFVCDTCQAEVTPVEDARVVSQSNEQLAQLEDSLSPILVAVSKVDRCLADGGEPPRLLPRVGAVAKADGARKGGVVPGGGAQAAADAAHAGDDDLVISMEADDDAGAGAGPSKSSTLFWERTAGRGAGGQDGVAAASEQAPTAPSSAAWDDFAARVEQQRKLHAVAALPAHSNAPPPTAAPPPKPPGDAQRGGDEDEDDDWEDAPIVMVQGQAKKLTEVTEDDQEAMTAEEYEVWYKLHAEG